MLDSTCGCAGESVAGDSSSRKLRPSSVTPPARASCVSACRATCSGFATLSRYSPRAAGSANKQERRLHLGELSTDEGGPECRTRPQAFSQRKGRAYGAEEGIALSCRNAVLIDACHDH